jgi:hypothetical protein
MTKTIKVKLPHVHNFRKLYDSENAGAMFAATCPIVSIFGARNEIDALLEINPREQKQTSVPSKAMHETLRDNPKSFVFRNRGLTFVAQDVTWDNKTEELEMTFAIDLSSDSQVSGLGDGGHTYDVIKDFVGEVEEAAQKELPAEVRLDIITGFDANPDEINAIVEARNTSTQVQEESLLNAKGYFAPIEEILAGQKYANQIAYYENQPVVDNDPNLGYRPIKVNTVLSYLMCFDQGVFSENQHPTIAYSSKRKALDWYKGKFEKDSDDLNALVKIMPQILDLHDYIEAQIPEIWNKISGRLADQKGVKKLKKEEALDFSDYKTRYVIPGGFVYPILSAFRSLLVKKGGEYSFRKDPKEIFERMNAESGRSLLWKLVNVQDKDPQAMGKNPELYDSCYGSLRGYYYEHISQ